MLRELVSNNIFVFSSELYAQVTAGAIVTSEGAIVIDTMPFPIESRQIATLLASATISASPSSRSSGTIRKLPARNWKPDKRRGETLTCSGAAIMMRR